MQQKPFCGEARRVEAAVAVNVSFSVEGLILSEANAPPPCSNRRVSQMLRLGSEPHHSSSSPAPREREEWCRKRRSATGRSPSRRPRLLQRLPLPVMLPLPPRPTPPLAAAAAACCCCCRAALAGPLAAAAEVAAADATAAAAAAAARAASCDGGGGGLRRPAAPPPPAVAAAADRCSARCAWRRYSGGLTAGAGGGEMERGRPLAPLAAQRGVGRGTQSRTPPPPPPLPQGQRPGEWRSSTRQRRRGRCARPCSSPLLKPPPRASEEAAAAAARDTAARLGGGLGLRSRAASKP